MLKTRELPVSSFRESGDYDQDKEGTGLKPERGLPACIACIASKTHKPVTANGFASKKEVGGLQANGVLRIKGRAVKKAQRLRRSG